MSSYAVVDSTTGRCVQVHHGLQAEPDVAEWMVNMHLQAVPDEFDGNAYYFSGVTPVAFPVKPSLFHRWDWPSKQWLDPRSLQDLKDARNRYVNTERLKANQTSFTHAGKVISADPLSRSDIDAINGEVANTGTFPADWPGAWKCLDNSWLPVTTVADWKALYTSMVNQGTQNFGHAQALKAQIEAAPDPAELALIVW